jgi:hypothetical protein
MLHRRKCPLAANETGSRRRQSPPTANTRIARDSLLLPGALLVTIQAQLFAPFMLVDFCLAAFFD